MTCVPRRELPDFLVIGAVKAGTTWLHRQLRAHPGLFLPIHKPVLYWDRHLDKPLARYASMFKAEGKIRGESTASYSVLPIETIHRMHQLMPDLRLVLLLREPRSRDWSEARMELTTVQGRDMASVGDEELEAFLRSDPCRQRGDYPSIVERWLRVFPPDQLFLGLYEDIEERPATLLKRIQSFLGVSPIPHDAAQIARRVFVGPTRAMPARCRDLLNERYGSAYYDRLGDVLAGHCHRWPDLNPANLARRWRAPT